MTERANELLRKIDAFLHQTGMTAAAFGTAAVKDPGLIADLKTGRELRKATRQKIEAFMNATVQQADAVATESSPEVGGKEIPFKWDDHDTVVREYGSIAVYQNKHDDIVIRQKNELLEDSFVIVSQVNAKAVVDAIQARIKK